MSILLSENVAITLDLRFLPWKIQFASLFNNVLHKISAAHSYTEWRAWQGKALSHFLHSISSSSGLNQLVLHIFLSIIRICYPRESRRSIRPGQFRERVNRHVARGIAIKGKTCVFVPLSIVLAKAPPKALWFIFFFFFKCVFSYLCTLNLEMAFSFIVSSLLLFNIHLHVC